MSFLKNKNIAFVDDEHAVIKPYRDWCIDAGAVPHIFGYVTDMLTHFNETNPPFVLNAIVADLQMPKPDSVLDKDFVEAGSLTGLWMLNKLKDEIVKRKIAVIVLTNVGEDHFEPYLQKLGYPDTRLVAHRKIDLPAKKLPYVIKERIEIAQR